MEKQLHNREVWVWGAKTLGITAYFLLKRLYSVQPAGIIDNDPLRQKSSIDNTAICSFAAFQEKKNASSYIMIASSQYAGEMAALCESMGMRKDRDYAMAEDILGPMYQIDITNVCNLSCPSCPQGNYPQKLHKPIMTLALFTTLIDKILDETPNVASVSLFYLGENLLVNNIHHYIELLEKRSIPCFLSSNLNINKNIDAIVLSKPQYIRVSTSGYHQNTYSIDHKGGNVDLLKSNMRLLRSVMNDNKIDIYVEVAYHMYKYNKYDEKQKMKELCDELMFSFLNFNATLLAVENMIHVIEGSIPKTIDPALLDRFEFDVRNFPCVAIESPQNCYFFKNNITITASGHVMVCCATCDIESSSIAEDCFTIDFRTVRDLKRANKTCQKCLRYGIPRLYDTVVGELDRAQADKLLRGTARTIRQNG